MHIALTLTLVAASLALSCGGGPAPQGDRTEAAPDAPDPDRANPCDATSIDPTENPCVGPAADAARREAEAAMATEGDRASGEAAADDDDGSAPAPAPGTAGPGDEGEPEGAAPPAETTPEG
ncbi:MAG: hypothetical protein R3F65_02810 [bacterium]